MRKLGFALLLGALGCPALRAQDLQWGTVSLGEARSSLKVPGYVIPSEGALSIESARVQGRVVKILKREGDRVQRGDPLFEIASAECISLAQEKRGAQERGIQELIEGTRRREEQLGLQVADGGCQALATHPGTLTKRQVELGSVFNIGDPLATILDIGHLVVELEVSERDLPQIGLGDVVRFQLASEPGKTLRTTIEHILPTIDPVSRTSKVRLAPVPLPEGATLDSLVFAEIEVGSGRRAFHVPSASVVFRHDRRYVVKKTAAGPRPVPVRVIGETEDSASVLPDADGSLKAGDQVAVKGAIFVLNEADPQ